jgi:hypothetical protein
MPAQEPSPLPTEHLTWAVLLGRWVDFARSALALPDDESGKRLRDSVPDIIMLQALWFALQHLGDLNEDEQALGLDRAQVLIDKHVSALRRRFPGKTMPQTLRQLIDDARAQLSAAGGRMTNGPPMGGNDE